MDFQLGVLGWNESLVAGIVHSLDNAVQRNLRFVVTQMQVFRSQIDVRFRHAGQFTHCPFHGSGTSCASHPFNG